VVPWLEDVGKAPAARELGQQEFLYCKRMTSLAYLMVGRHLAADDLIYRNAEEIRGVEYAEEVNDSRTTDAPRYADWPPGR